MHPKALFISTLLAAAAVATKQSPSEFDVCPRKLMCNFIEAEKESQCVSVCVPKEKLAPAAAQAIAAMSETFVQENSMPPESLHIPANARALEAEIVEAAKASTTLAPSSMADLMGKAITPELSRLLANGDYASSFYSDLKKGSTPVWYTESLPVEARDFWSNYKETWTGIDRKSMPEETNLPNDGDEMLNDGDGIPKKGLAPSAPGLDWQVVGASVAGTAMLALALVL